MVLRQCVSLPLNAVGLALTSIYLSPKDFGAYAILTIGITLAFAVIDSGISAALLQARERASRKTTIHIQVYKHITCILLVALAVFGGGVLESLFGFGNGFEYLVAACPVVALLQSERSHFAVKLQRAFDWQAIAKIEMLEILSYNALLVVAAMMIRDPACFVFAQAARFILGGGLLLMTAHRSGYPGFQEANGVLIGALLRFGLPYQATMLCSITQKASSPILLTSSGGGVAVGLFNWSSTVSALPLAPFQPLYSVLFSLLTPHSAVAAESLRWTRRLVSGAIFVSGLIAIAIIAVLPGLVKLLDGEHWVAAIPVASLLLLGNILAVAAGILTTQLAASGHSAHWLRIVVVETVLIWLFAGVGGWLAGVVGYAAGYLMASAIVYVIIVRAIYVKIGVAVGIQGGLFCLLFGVLSAFIPPLSLELTGFTGLTKYVLSLTVSLFVFVLLNSVLNYALFSDLKELSSVIYPKIKAYFVRA